MSEMNNKPPDQDDKAEKQDETSIAEANEAEAQARLRKLLDETIPGYTLFDDEFMNAVYNNQPGLVQDLLRAVCKDDSITVRSATVQEVHPNLHGHGSRLDIVARGAKHGRPWLWNIEIQRKTEGGSRARAWFNVHSLALESVPKGASYEMLPQIETIFVMENAEGAEMLPVATTETIVRESGEIDRWAGTVTFVDGSYRGDDALGHYLSDMAQSDPDQIGNDALAERVRYLKRTEGGRAEVSEAMRAMLSIVQESNERTIREQQEALNEKDGTIREQQEALNAKDGTIRGQQEALNAKDIALNAKDIALDEKDDEIARLRKLLEAHGIAPALT